MKLLLKLLILSMAVGIIYYLIVEVHLLEVILDYVSNFFKSFLGYASEKFINLLGNLI